MLTSPWRASPPSAPPLPPPRHKCSIPGISGSSGRQRKREKGRGRPLLSSAQPPSLSPHPIPLADPSSPPSTLSATSQEFRTPYPPAPRHRGHRVGRFGSASSPPPPHRDFAGKEGERLGQCMRVGRSLMWREQTGRGVAAAASSVGGGSARRWLAAATGSNNMQQQQQQQQTRRVMLVYYPAIPQPLPLPALSRGPFVAPSSTALVFLGLTSPPLPSRRLLRTCRATSESEATYSVSPIRGRHVLEG